MRRVPRPPGGPHSAMGLKQALTKFKPPQPWQTPFLGLETPTLFSFIQSPLSFALTFTLGSLVVVVGVGLVPAGSAPTGPVPRLAH